MAYYRFRGIMTFKWPMKNGVITNWDDWEKLLHQTFYNQLRICPEEHPMTFVVKPTLWSEKQLMSKLIQNMYETFATPCLCLLPADVATLHQVSLIERRNLMTGCVLGSGEGTAVSCVFEGASLSYTLVVNDNNGSRGVAERLEKNLKKKVHEKRREEIQNTLLFCIPFEPEQFIKQAQEESVRKTITKTSFLTMTDPPEGEEAEIVELDSELYLPCEVLFEGPKNMALMIVESIAKCPVDLQPAMYNNIVLEGKNTLYPGFTSRLNWELEKIVDCPFTIRSYSCRGEIAYNGASSAAEKAMQYYDEKTFENYFIPLEEYDEVGPDVLWRRFQQNCPMLPLSLY